MCGTRRGGSIWILAQGLLLMRSAMRMKALLRFVWIYFCICVSILLPQHGMLSDVKGLGEMNSNLHRCLPLRAEVMLPILVYMMLANETLCD
jgi:hypothetical protein